MGTINSSKFMQSLGDSAYTKLRRIANERDITIQELIRAIVIPDWLKTTEQRNGGESQSAKHRKLVSRSRTRTMTVPMLKTSKVKKRQ